MSHRLATTLLPFVLLVAPSIPAQTKQSPMPDMPGMDTHSTQMPMPQNAPATPMNMDMMKPPTNLIEAELNHTNSGTSLEPASTPVSMIMSQHGAWMLMLH